MNKRESILNAGLELLVEKGVHNTPMSEIAKAARTGMGTIYNYFKNKDELINTIYVGIKEEEETLFLEVNTEQSVKEQFVNYLTVIIDFFIQHPTYFKFLQQLEFSPIITKENREKGKKSVDMVAVLLEKGQETGIIKNMTMSKLLVFIGGGISSYLNHYLNTPDKTSASIKNHIDMVWDGIKA